MSGNPLSPACPLCGGASSLLLRDERDFQRCVQCALTFVPASQHLTAQQERGRYEQHRNAPGDAGYRAFLDRLLIPLIARLPPGAKGLDFGCGPAPTVSTMLRERGFVMRDHDPIFARGEQALARDYDFVTCTEVVEHLRAPSETLARLDGLLRPGGTLGIMTGVLEDDASFAGWWYRRDATHVAFYRPETLAWIGRRFGWTEERPSRDVAIFVKPR